MVKKNKPIKITEKDECEKLKEKITKLEKELELLLNGVKLEDKLKISNEYILNKDKKILGGKMYNRGSLVKILDIRKKEKEYYTITIVYNVDGGDSEYMSKGNFILYFCEDIKKAENITEKLKRLKDDLKRIESSLDTKCKISITVDEVQSRIFLIQKVIKFFNKKFNKEKKK